MSRARLYPRARARRIAGHRLDARREHAALLYQRRGVARVRVCYWARMPAALMTFDQVADSALITAVISAGVPPTRS